MIELNGEEDEIEGDAGVSFLPHDRDTLFNNEFKMKFEYVFKEKVKLVKLRGGNGPKGPKVKKEKTVINLGGGGAAAAAAAKEAKKDKKGKVKVRCSGKDNDSEEEKEPEKKEATKMDLASLLGGGPAKTGEDKGTA